MLTGREEIKPRLPRTMGTQGASGHGRKKIGRKGRARTDGVDTRSGRPDIDPGGDVTRGEGFRMRDAALKVIDGHESLCVQGEPGRPEPCGCPGSCRRDHRLGFQDLAVSQSKTVRRADGVAGQDVDPGVPERSFRSTSHPLGVVGKKAEISQDESDQGGRSEPCTRPERKFHSRGSAPDDDQAIPRPVLRLSSDLEPS